jgi:hypothetical protein
LKISGRKEPERMNHYGTMAQRHWQRWLPTRYATIQDPDSFFSTLGEEVAQQIGDLGLDLAGDDPAGEGYLERVGQLNMARLQAEEIVLKERVLLDPEPGTDPDPQDLDEQSSPMGERDRPLIVDRSHPLWEQVNAEQEDLAHGR